MPITNITPINITPNPTPLPNCVTSADNCHSNATRMVLHGDKNPQNHPNFDAFAEPLDQLKSSLKWRHWSHNPSGTFNNSENLNNPAKHWLPGFERCMKMLAGLDARPTIIGTPTLRCQAWSRLLGSYCICNPDEGITPSAAALPPLKKMLWWHWALLHHCDSAANVPFWEITEDGLEETNTHHMQLIAHGSIATAYCPRSLMTWRDIRVVKSEGRIFGGSPVCYDISTFQIIHYFWSR